MEWCYVGLFAWWWLLYYGQDLNMGNVSVEALKNEAKQGLHLSCMKNWVWNYSIILALFKDVFNVLSKIFLLFWL